MVTKVELEYVCKWCTKCERLWSVEFVVCGHCNRGADVCLEERRLTGASTLYFRDGSAFLIKSGGFGRTPVSVMKQLANSPGFFRVRERCISLLEIEAIRRQECEW